MAAGGDELAPLDGYRVAVTADRRAAELAELLARKGADVLLAPAIRTLPLGDEDSLRRVTEEVVELPPTLVLAITGIGMRSWFGAAEAWGLDSQLRESLRLARTVARGPKAAAAVLQAGLEVWRQEPTERLGPLVAALERDGDLDGARVALQLPGEDLPEAVATMAGAGAVVTAVPVYRWVQPADPSPVIRLVQAAIAGRVDAVTFTSAPAVRSFMLAADEAALGPPLRDAFTDQTVAACVGPVTGEAARRAGLSQVVWPERGRLGLLVRTLADYLMTSRCRIGLAGTDVIVQGSALLCSGKRIQLSSRERAVLVALMRRPGAVVPKSVLLREVWGFGVADPHLLEATVSRLRRRLGPAGLSVLLTRRRGYRLVAA